MQLLWNRIWSSRGVKVTNVPQVLLCLPLHFYQGIQTDVWWIILGRGGGGPFSVFDWLGIPNPEETVGFIFPMSVFGHPSGAVFRMYLTFCVALPSHRCWGDGFMDSLLSSDESPLGTYRFYIQLLLFLPLSHRVSFQALFCIDWAQLSHHLLPNQFPRFFLLLQHLNYILFLTSLFELCSCIS